MGLVVLPDRRTLACNHNREIVLYDMESGEERQVLRGHVDNVYQLALSPDGRTLISGSGDGTVKFWDVSKYGDKVREK